MLTLFQPLNLLCWLLALAVLCVVIYSPYSNHDSHIFTVPESAAFIAWHRIAWGAALGYIVIACSSGHGGAVQCGSLQCIPQNFECLPFLY